MLLRSRRSDSNCITSRRALLDAPPTQNGRTLDVFYEMYLILGRIF